MNKVSDTQDIFISNVLVIDKSSPYNSKKVDILIQKGVFSKIGKNLKEPFGAVSISGKNLHASVGFADLHVNVQDPGYEYKEDIESALSAASAGGFTGILSCSTTDPCIDNKSGIQYQEKKAQGNLVDLWISGSISKKQEGKELSEMYDMHMAGAKAFYDFKSDIRDSQLLKLALLYVKSFNGIIMVHPSEHYLSSGGEVNEGEMSTKNGLKGIPAIAEEIGIQRSLKLAEYTNQAIHFTTVSTKEGIDLIKKAKKRGIKVTCGVSVANLLFNEDKVAFFDSNYKVNPPLRDEKNRKSLIEALKAGTIDVVVSDHWPQNVEGKECEFEVADFGMNTLESTFAMLRTATSEKIELDLLIDILTKRSREIIKVPVPSIKENEKANLTIFQPNNPFDFDSKKSLSSSRNMPEVNDLIGNVMAVINNNRVHLNP